MKHKTMYIALALVAALTAGALAGCGQKASSESEPAPDAAPAATEQATTEQAATDPSTDEVIAELQNAVASNPAFKSVTVNETTSWAYVNEETAEPEAVQASAVYKFDISDNQLKESVAAEFGDIKMQYFTDDKNAVFVFDGTAYSGTDEQFGAQDYSGFDDFIKHTIGDFDSLVGCTVSAEKMESNGMTLYTLTLDPEKYVASDAILAALAEAGFPVKGASLTIGFDEKGMVSLMNETFSFEASTITENLAFSDFDSTVVDPAPEATKTYEEMGEDLQHEIEGLMKQLDSFEVPADEAAAANAAEAK